MSAPRDLLSDLPPELREEVTSFSSLRELGFLAQISKQFEAETAFPRLLTAAIHAAPKSLDAKDAKQDPTALAAIAILKRHLKLNPELLFREDKDVRVTDHHGRKICGSPYKIILGAGDIWALRQIHTDILPHIQDGEKQAEAQFKEQFPNCSWPLPEIVSEEMLYDNRNKQQIKAIKEQLATVKDLIDDDPFDNNKPLDATQQAIERLCQLFQPKSFEVICSGLHFPLAIINEVYNTYNSLQGHWSFFSLAVIKPVLDALSTVDGQCCRDGLKDLDMKKGPNRRCHSSYQHPLGQPLNLKLVDDWTWFNIKSSRLARMVDPYDGDVIFDSVDYPGYFDWYDKIGGAVRPGCAVAGSCWDAHLVRSLENLCRTKAVAYRGYYAITSGEANTLSQ